MKPPAPYFGGKITLGPVIAALLPDHRHYVEPYCGSLAVLLAKQPSVMETVNDLDGALMTFWRMVRDRPADLERVCALTPHSRAMTALVLRGGARRLPLPAMGQEWDRPWVREGMPVPDDVFPDSADVDPFTGEGDGESDA